MRIKHVFRSVPRNALQSKKKAKEKENGEGDEEEESDEEIGKFLNVISEKVAHASEL